MSQKIKWHSENEMVNLRSVIETLCYMVDDDSDGVEEILQLPTIDLVRCKECIDNSINCDGEENWCLRRREEGTMRLIDADKLEPIEVGIDEMSFLAVDYEDIKNAPTIEPNLVINPDEVERGDVVEIGENIVVMHHDDYYDMFLKSAAVDDGSWERFVAEPCEDAISRAEAVEIAYAYCPDDDGSCTKGDRDIRELLDDLKSLPSVAPSRPSGEWIVNREGLNTNCSNCGKGFKDAYGLRPVSTYNFCPNCGCRMKGADDE